MACKDEVNGVQQFATSLTAMGSHMPDGIIECYLPHGRGAINEYDDDDDAFTLAS